MTPSHSGAFKNQPRAVWAVLFACVVAFMGIGLVDPILPIIAKGIDANPSQVELLFTSYFAIIGLSNLLAGFVASRIGTKRTLLGGLALVVLCSAAAGSSDTVSAVVGFRAGWGLGIALFISTSMAVLVGSAVGGISTAVILFESALGVGIASGPLIGGLLGGVTWRAPFFGVAVLMSIAFVAILTQVESAPASPKSERMSLSAPLRALRDPGLLTASVVALFYNFGFFTLLAYTPLPLHLGVHALGIVFFGWGVMVALGAILGAPALLRRFYLVPLLTGTLALIGLDLLVIALGIHSQPVMIAAIVVSGLLLGLANSLISNLLLDVSTVETSVTTSGTNFVRFAGGAAAPFLAGKLSEQVSEAAPLFLATAVVTAGVLLLFISRRMLSSDVAQSQLDAAPEYDLLPVSPGIEGESARRAA